MAAGYHFGLIYEALWDNCLNIFLLRVKQNQFNAF